jgi:hypothetical protein
MSEANVEIIRRHYEIRHGKGGKRREVGMDDRSWEHPRRWIALVRRSRSVRCSASSTDRRADPPLRAAESDHADRELRRAHGMIALGASGPSWAADIPSICPAA